MDTRTPCRFFQLGTCWRGEECAFSHNPAAMQAAGPVGKRVCSYFMEGNCAFGPRCRFAHPTVADNGHAAPARALNASAPAWTPGAPAPQYDHNGCGNHHGEGGDEDDYGSDEERFLQEIEEKAFLAEQAHLLDEALSDDEIQSVPSIPPTPQTPAEGLPSAAFAHDPAEAREPRPNEPLCTNYYALGTCPRGARCTFAHGLLCQVCNKCALHPDNEEERQAHQAACAARRERLADAVATAEVECGICLERVVERDDPADRKFGLLDCEHAFCLSCIRSWRLRTDTEADVDTAVRTCPVCRSPSWFVTPSSTWPSSVGEKERIQAAYKAKLGSIDCRHFDKGAGQCPFGTSCFYRHVYADGCPEVNEEAVGQEQDSIDADRDTKDEVKSEDQADVRAGDEQSPSKDASEVKSSAAAGEEAA